MKNADDEFIARKAPLLDTISEKALQIARSIHWPAVVIEMSGVAVAAAGSRGNVRCFLRNPLDAWAIDELSARLIFAQLQAGVGVADIPGRAPVRGRQWPVQPVADEGHPPT
jgi:hypothetical protein